METEIALIGGRVVNLAYPGPGNTKPPKHPLAKISYDPSLRDRYTDVIESKTTKYEDVYLNMSFTLGSDKPSGSDIKAIHFDRSFIGIHVKSKHRRAATRVSSFMREYPDKMYGFVQSLTREIKPIIECTIDMSLKQLIDLATGSRSVETACSSPSMVLHQMTSLFLIKSLPGASVFESSNFSMKPDITYYPGPSDYIRWDSILIEVTSSNSISSKLPLVLTGLPVFIIDKYKLWQAIIYKLTMVHNVPQIHPAIQWLEHLIQMSIFNDENDWAFMQSCIDRQKRGTKDSQLYSPDVVSYFSKRNAKVLEHDWKTADRAFKNYISQVEVSDKVSEISWDLASSLSCCSWLGFPVAKRGKDATPLSHHQDSSCIFQISSDRLILSSEEQVAGKKEFFEVEHKDDYLIDSRTVDAILRYDRDPDKVTADDLKFYNETLRSIAPGRNKNYFRERVPGKMRRVDPNRPESDFTAKSSKPFSRLLKLHGVQPVKYKTMRTVQELHASIYSLDGYSLDPIDEQILDQSGADMTLKKALRKNKIYHLLNLFRKAAESLCFAAKDDRSFSVQSSYTDMELHIYTSGAVQQTDKGVAYVSLVSSGQLVKTWAWRSADISNFKLASSRLISTLTGAWNNVPSNRKIFLMTLYSLLLLENSWGVSTVLKPYRYLVTGMAYGSPLVNQQMDKFNEAISEKRDMCRNKMSLNYMFDVLANQISETGTPLFGLNQENMGFEAFLMNLCPYQTYGKRRHQVNMLKEIEKEIKLSNRCHPDVLQAQEEFIKLIQLKDQMLHDEGGDSDLVDRLFFDYFQMHSKRSDRLSGRFTFTPMSVLLIYGEVQKISLKSSFQGTVSPISDLLTMKSSFDPIRFKNGSALNSIVELCKHENLTTTVSLAINLTRRMVDLTFRMFDKDQLGGDREISIMSAEFRILQSITENFARKLGQLTGIDMLANPSKVSLLAEAQNQANKFGGIRETVDQTRWGPNFNTVTFGYMFTLFSRFTTEAFMPAYTCFISEHKYFQMLPYPELANLMQSGTSLPGLKGAYHMGQGIFHYSSSLYHSLVHGYLARCKQEAMSSIIKDPNFSLGVRTFVTSDDVAVVNFFSMANPNDRLNDDERSKAANYLIRYGKAYPQIIQQFGIKTSAYKNMISDSCFEFNSIFLNADSVGSNSLKFLYSLIEPYTSGDQKRDMRAVADSFVDSLNSGLTEREADIVSNMNLKHRCLQWGASSQTIKDLLDLKEYFSQDAQEMGLGFAGLKISMTAQTISRDTDSDIICNTVLPYNKYKEHQNALTEFASMLDYEISRFDTEVKKETLSRAKKRRLGSNRGLVLSNKLRQKSQIVLPFGNRTGATMISGPAYLAALFKDKSEQSLINTDNSFVAVPRQAQGTLEEGFSMKKYKVTDYSSVTVQNLLFSSYPRVPCVSSKSTDLDIILHIGRHNQIIRLLNAHEFEDWSYEQRYLYFDELVSNNRAGGSAQQMVYSREYDTYTSFIFPAFHENMTYVPSVMLLRTTEELGNRGSCDRSIYDTDLVRGNYATNPAVGPRIPLNYVSEQLYELDPSCILESAQELLRTDKDYGSTSSSMEKCYVNVSIMVSYKSSGQEKGDYDTSMGGCSIEITDEMRAMIAQAFASEGFDLEAGADSTCSFNESSDDDDDLNAFFMGSDSKVKHLIFSIPASRYLMCIGQSWFSKHTVYNANLLSLIRQGFVQNVTESQPEALLYSCLENARQVRSFTVMEHVLKRTNYVVKLRLSSLFHLKTVLKQLAGSTQFAGTTTSQTSKMRDLFSLIENRKSLTLDLIHGLPAGVSITDEPTGVLVTLKKARELFDLRGIDQPLTGALGQAFGHDDEDVSTPESEE